MLALPSAVETNAATPDFPICRAMVSANPFNSLRRHIAQIAGGELDPANLLDRPPRRRRLPACVADPTNCRSNRRLRSSTSAATRSGSSAGLVRSSRIGGVVQAAFDSPATMRFSGRSAGDGLDPAHPGAETPAFAGDAEQADIAGALHMGAAA